MENNPYLVNNIIMATIKERLATLEIEVRSLQKTQWFLIVSILGQVGFEFIPMLFTVIA